MLSAMKNRLDQLMANRALTSAEAEECENMLLQIVRQLHETWKRKRPEERGKKSSAFNTQAAKKIKNKQS